eukprot:10750861-Ditylum_brightwellii.AAC.1
MEDYPEEIWQPYEEEAAKPEAKDYTPEKSDKYISAQVTLPLGDILERATVTSQKRDANGLPIGLANNNQMLVAQMYEVRFNNDMVNEYSVNIIAESLYSRVDSEGN